jgi:TRAP transporter TAXI family solute receptor
MEADRPALSLKTLIRSALAFVATLTFAMPSTAQVADQPQRVAFQISTGTTGGSYFPVGELLASLLSHPPGVGRCEAAAIVCGPPGLIVSTRASEGSVANVLAVNAGSVSSGIAQADVVALAVAGQGPFRKSGPAKQVRVIANLYGEDLHLIAAKNAKIKSVADLKGKRVSLSTETSGTIVTARAVLSAYRLTEKSIVPNYDPTEKATELLQDGKLDALFFVGGTPVNLIEQMIDEGVAVLVPIDGDGRKRLLTREPYLSAHTIPGGTYAGSPPVETVGVDALWITDVPQPDNLIYGIVRALYNPLNRAAIEPRKVGRNFLDPNTATENAAAPLHPGAARYFMEAGLLKPPPAKTPAAAAPPAPPAPRKS